MTELTMALPRTQASDIAADLCLKLDVAISGFAEGKALLDTVCQNGESGFSCSSNWVGHWANCVNSNIAVVTVIRNGKMILALPLEVVNKSGLKAAQYVGGSHANANFPALISELSPVESVAFMDRLVAGLKAEPWSVDVVMLERQLAELGGMKNPLLNGGSSISPNVSLHLNVDQTFDAVLETRSAKRKRKRNRSQQRKFEGAGGYTVLNPAPKTEVVPLLDSYFAMKAQQLSGKGVANVFGDHQEQAFFKALFSDELSYHDHQFFLSSLEVGGKTRAIYGSSMHGSRQMVHFTAFANDELTTASPGDFLNFALVGAACEAPTKTYDLGVGDEGYKRSWCDVETWHYDTIIGISVRGKLAKLQFDILRAAKRWIKNNEKLWSLAKRIRQLKNGQKTEAQASNPPEDGSEL